MSVALVARLLFMSEDLSFAGISRATGISYNTILRMRNPSFKVSLDNAKALRNAYSRFNYSKLKITGFAPKEAKRFRAYAPASASVRLMNRRLLANDLTTGVVSDKLAWYERQGMSKTLDDVWDDSYASVVRGLQHSRKTSEEIDRYLTDVDDMEITPYGKVDDGQLKVDDIEDED